MTAVKVDPPAQARPGQPSAPERTKAQWGGPAATSRQGRNVWPDLDCRSGGLWVVFLLKGPNRCRVGRGGGSRLKPTKLVGRSGRRLPTETYEVGRSVGGGGSRLKPTKLVGRSDPMLADCRPPWSTADPGFGPTAKCWAGAPTLEQPSPTLEQVAPGQPGLPKHKCWGRWPPTLEQGLLQGGPPPAQPSLQPSRPGQGSNFGPTGMPGGPG